MAEIVNMPKLGFDMAEGTLVRWVKAEGDRVERGEVLAEIETDKATVEVESQATGIIHKHLVQEGTHVPVGDPIAVVGEEGEEVDVETLAGKEAGAAQAAEPEEAEGQATADTREAPAPSEDGRERERVEGQLPGGVRASPVARRIAEEQKVDLSTVEGSGPGGRIVRKDVERALERKPARPEARPAYVAPGAPRETERIEVSRLRARIGQRMTESKQQIPHFYVSADLDAGPLMDLRRQANEFLPEEDKISVNDFLVKACALTLRDFPNLNASLEGDEIVHHGEINIGNAVAIEGGLLTVVVAQADLKPVRVIAQELRPMAERARVGKVRPEDVEGSTFTLSNMGMYGVEDFAAIINPPEVGILAVGRVRRLPVVEGDQIQIGQRLMVTLSADHRVSDGAEAAMWLARFREIIEQPLGLLL